MSMDILLIYPQLGSFDTLAKDIPLSLIYAATDSVKNGFNVKIVDLRLAGDHWQSVVDESLKDGCTLIGFSVMTGNPISTSLRVSSYIKGKYDIPIVWGGPHPTILPEQTLNDPLVDFIIRDWGSESLASLIAFLKNGVGKLSSIPGLGYKENGKQILNPQRTSFEILDYRDIPYDLVNVDANQYNRMKSGKLIFPFYTSMGCPWNCTFCMSPATYKIVKGKKWQPYDINTVLDHLEYLSQRYSIEVFQDYADESFIDLERMKDFLHGYIQRGFNLKYKLDFRGVRINDLDKMDDEYLRLMVEANVGMMFIGVESGSDRILGIMQKNITHDQIVRVNQKMARYPELKPHYNFFSGIPGETMESLTETGQLLEQLVKDHPGCYLGYGAHWKPIPGSAITDTAVREFGYKLPSTLIEWADIDSFDAATPNYPWYTPQMSSMINLLGIAGLLMDAKTKDYTPNLGPILGGVARFLIRLYRPFLKLRIDHSFTDLLIEEKIKTLALKNIGKLMITSD
jgi:anaerobic magnesium-protoporphyrin IX monomethyl ester cyclase